MKRPGRWAAVAALLAALVGPLDAASLYQPRLAFRVLATPHFRIYYHQGGEAQARRLAAIAEAVRADLQARTRLPAPAMTHVVLANQDDDANGSATPLPYPTVRLSAAWPAASELIGNTDDWLRMVFVHEFAHVVQLERTRGWARVARAILGRSAVSFPNLFLPEWQIEGYATFWESRLTGRGRLEGGDARAIVAERARAGRLPLDQANGGVVDWPGGNIPYLEGAWFHAYLARRFGEERLGDLNEMTAGRLPYLSAPAFRRVFGHSLGDLWRDFQRQLVESRTRTGEPTPARKLTDQGYIVTSPRFDGDGTRVVFSVRDPHGFPTVRAVVVHPPAAEDGGVPSSRVVTDRFGGRSLAVRQGLVFFDEIELRDNVAWRSDLWVADLGTGRRQRLSNDGRLLEPDVSADGRQLACVRVDGDGTQVPAFFTVDRLAGGRVSLTPGSSLVKPEPGFTYGAPRWSPDGRRIAFERRRAGGPAAAEDVRDGDAGTAGGAASGSDIVVFDLTDGSSRAVARAARGRVITPAWTPDGRLVYASDASGEFQLYAAAPERGQERPLTAASGGAMFPDVSPDGRTLAFVGTGPEGHDVYTVPIDDHRPSDVRADASRSETAAAERPLAEPPVELRAYSPWPTLLPRSWTPLAASEHNDLRLGFGVSGADVLARHRYAVSALWRVIGDNGSGAPASRPDWSASYAYDRWRPIVFAAAADQTSLLDLARGDGGPPVPAALREQDATVGLSVPFRKVRHTQAWQAAFNAGTDTLSSRAASVRTRRPAVRGAWAIATGKQYGWSISTEDGVAASLTTEQVRAALGADGDADAFTGQVRAYWRPGRGHAVLAARAGYGASSGDASVRRRFFLGGATPAGPLVDFGGDAFRMLRGFDSAVSFGDRIAVASVEWRQPILRLERGWGTFPALVRSIHGAVFLDAGQTWDRGFRLSDTKTSVGAEAAVDLVAGYWFRLTLTVGAAWAHDPAPAGISGGAFYVRTGPSF